MIRGENVYPTALCRCRARVIWGVVNPELKSGHRVAVDAEPSTRGDHVLARDPGLPRDRGAVQIRVTKLRPGQAAGYRADGWSLYRLHSSWCPQADAVRNAARHAKKGGRR